MAVLAGGAHCGPVPGRTLRPRWTVLLPAVQHGPATVSAGPCRSSQCPLRRTPAGCRYPQVRPLSASGPSVSAGCVNPGPIDQADEQARTARRWPSCCDRDRVCPQSCGSRVHRGHGSRQGGVRVAGELDTAAASPVRCCFRNRGRTAGVRRGHRGQGYRKESPGRRPLVGWRHGRDAWLSWPASRSRSHAGPKSSPAAPTPKHPRRSAHRTGAPGGGRPASSR
jgi:hypothetical protein